MYRDLTHSAEALRRERYRVGPPMRGPQRNRMQETLGRVLLSVGSKLLGRPVAPRLAERASA